MNNCTICNSSRTEVYVEKIQSVYSNKSYQLARCQECTHIFTSPLPTPELLTHIYTHDYAYDVHLVIEPEKRYRARQTANYITNYTFAKSICEPGCMYGFLLTELQQRGLSVLGIEIDSQAVDYCKQHNIPVIKSSLEDYTSKQSKKFDLVVLSHALEHILDPHQELTQIQQLLSDDGMILIIVPNTESWTQKITKKYWGYWQVPVHINHFNARSLSTLLQHNNYSIVDVQYRGGDSLLFLSLLANLLRVRANKRGVIGAKKVIIRAYSWIAKYWYHIGNDDLLILAKKNKP